jgi:hypothetical protein
MHEKLKLISDNGDSGSKKCKQGNGGVPMVGSDRVCIWLESGGWLSVGVFGYLSLQ